MQELDQAREMAEKETGQAQAAEPQRTESAQTVSRAEMQQEIDRVAKRERERGRRQALRAQKEPPKAPEQAAPEKQSGPGGTQEEAEDAIQRTRAQDGIETQKTAKAPQADPADALGAEEQRMLGAALAQKTIGQGPEAVQQRIEQLALADRTLTPREDEWLFCLFNHASLQACSDELTRRGADGAAVLKDERFIEFAAMMRGDVPLTTVYEQYRKTQGHRTKPLSTGPVEGQGPQGPPYFSQEQVKRMTRKQVKAHYNDIEKSRRFWS